VTNVDGVVKRPIYCAAIIIHIHRRAAEIAEKIIILHLPLRGRQIQPIMPPASYWQLRPAPKGLGLIFFALLSEKN